MEELEPRMVPAVLTPAQLRHAYGFDEVSFAAAGRTIQGDGSGQTIAIVNAYDNTRVFNDVDVFNRSFSIDGRKTLYDQYGAASKFLTKVNPQGRPGTDPTQGLWLIETALDVEWAHAMAPGARILLVQAKSNSYADLLGAVNYAKKQSGVVVVSLSWGSVEFQRETSFDSYFTTPGGHLGGSNGLGGPRLRGGVTFVAASGDSGAPGGYPAMSPNVLSVGGTFLDVDPAGNTLGEVAWSGSGGGVSAYETKPAFQATVSFSARANPDVAYNGDPASGVYVYSTAPLFGRVGSWWQVGGTSAGAPQWAALVAIANQGRALQGVGSLDGQRQTLPALYNMPAGNFHDITSGSNGYSATPGYDLATGRGSPVGNYVIADLVRADAQGALPPRPAYAGAPRPGVFQPILYVVAAVAPPDAAHAPPAAAGTLGRDLIRFLVAQPALPGQHGSDVHNRMLTAPQVSATQVASVQSTFRTPAHSPGMTRADLAQAAEAACPESSESPQWQPALPRFDEETTAAANPGCSLGDLDLYFARQDQGTVAAWPAGVALAPSTASASLLDELALAAVTLLLLTRVAERNGRGQVGVTVVDR